jgi:phosphoserine phosphatase RsbU/P
VSAEPLDGLLQRQLKRIGAQVDASPDGDAWGRLLRAVSDHYRKVTDDRNMLMRSMEISTDEMDVLRREIEKQRDSLRTLLMQVTETLGTFGATVRDRGKIVSGSPDGSSEVDSIRSEFTARLANLFDTQGDSEEVSVVRSNLAMLADQIIALLAEASSQGGMAKELELARAAQQLLLPDESVRLSGARFASLFEPATECGGDFWAAYALPEGKSLVLLGDVTGHGAAAAILTGVVRGVCDTSARIIANLSPSVLLEELNRVLFGVAKSQMMMTCACALYDPRTRQISISNAGHPSGLLVRGPNVSQVSGAGNPLGATPFATFETTEIILLPNDTLVWFSDGILEMESPEGEAYGERRFRAVCQKYANRPPAEMVQAVRESLATFRAHMPVGDDLTLLVVTFL